MEGEVTWGSWEELVLGAAVERHGTQDWTNVAAELRPRARTPTPSNFTPQVCKAKYEDLQQRYSGCTLRNLVEKLRKKRIEDLKRRVERSDDTIRRLQAKFESLKAAVSEEGDDCRVDDGSTGLELDAPPQKLERVESSLKEASKDGLSAGSFTHETRAKWSPECQVPAVSSKDMETNKLEVSRFAEQEKVSVVDKLVYTLVEGKGVSYKRRRGARRRKDSGYITNGAGFGERGILVSGDVSQCKESSTSNFDEVAKSPGIGEGNANFKKEGIEDMMEILDSVMETQGASLFLQRHDSQKRGRYKNMIRRHMDFETIRSRISSQTIKSIRELFRDMLLLANNALIFYSKCTREYKTALLLREIVTKKLRENSNGSGSSVTHANVSTALPVRDSPEKVKRALPVHDSPENVRRTRSGDHKVVAKAVVAAAGGSNRAKKPGEVDSSPSVDSLPIKKAFGRPRKVGLGAASERPATPVKGKKRGKGK